MLSVPPSPGDSSMFRDPGSSVYSWSSRLVETERDVVAKPPSVARRKVESVMREIDPLPTSATLMVTMSVLNWTECCDDMVYLPSVRTVKLLSGCIGSGVASYVYEKTVVGFISNADWTRGSPAPSA